MTQVIMKEKEDEEEKEECAYAIKGDSDKRVMITLNPRNLSACSSVSKEQ